MRYIFMSIVAFGTWLLWSGHYTLDHTLVLAMGILSCAFVVYLSGRLSIVDEEGYSIRLVWNLALYIPWLIWAIVKANIDVAKRILSPGLPIAPRIIRVQGNAKNRSLSGHFCQFNNPYPRHGITRSGWGRNSSPRIDRRSR